MKESLEDRTFEIIQSEEQKEKKNKKEFKKKKSPQDLWDRIKRNKICIMKIPEREEKGMQSI